MDFYPKWDYLEKQKKYEKQKAIKEFIKLLILWLIIWLFLVFLFIGNVSF